MSLDDVIALSRGDLASSAFQATAGAPARSACVPLLHIQAQVDVTGGALVTIGARRGQEREVVETFVGDREGCIDLSQQLASFALAGWEKARLLLVHAPWQKARLWTQELAGPELTILVSSVGWRGAPEFEEEAAWYDGPLAVAHGSRILAFVPAGGDADLIVPAAHCLSPPAGCFALEDAKQAAESFELPCLYAAVATFARPWTRALAGCDIIASQHDFHAARAPRLHAALGLMALRTMHPTLSIRLIIDTTRGQIPSPWRSLVKRLGMTLVEDAARVSPARFALAELATVVARFAVEPQRTHELTQAINERSGGMIPRALADEAGLA